MARVIDNQTNIWAKQNGAEPQRTDLWVIDFGLALTGLGNVVAAATQMSSGLPAPTLPARLASYFCYSVGLPDLKVRPEIVGRDSRPYPVPGYDEPLEPARISFMLDCYKPGGALVSPYKSDVYQMLDIWRAVVRAGRGSMSTEYAITLDANYRIDYAFDIRLLMLRPSSRISISDIDVTNDLEYSMQLRLVNAWLGQFKISEFTYEGTKVAMIDTLFYVEDVRQETQRTTNLG